MSSGVLKPSLWKTAIPYFLTVTMERNEILSTESNDLFIQLIISYHEWFPREACKQQELQMWILFISVETNPLHHLRAHWWKYNYAPLPMNSTYTSQTFLFYELNMRLIFHDWETVWKGKWKKIILCYSEIAINWHKIITYLAISKSSEQLSAT